MEYFFHATLSLKLTIFGTIKIVKWMNYMLMSTYYYSLVMYLLELIYMSSKWNIYVMMYRRLIVIYLLRMEGVLKRMRVYLYWYHNSMVLFLLKVLEILHISSIDIVNRLKIQVMRNSCIFIKDSKYFCIDI